ncbi:MAG: hypothetical protein JXD23_17710 [Spirochaetales bacterium]|nr:hypothetical protein [Spirochaetales bacterium]
MRKTMIHTAMTAALILMAAAAAPIAAQEKSFHIVSGAKLVDPDTSGRTKWDTLVDRGGRFFITPSPLKGFDDTVSFITLPDLKLETLDVPLRAFFEKNKSLVVEEKLDSELRGKLRKNYWIEDCFFFDTANGEAGLRVINYFLLKKGQAKRTFFVRWDLRTNEITGALPLFEETHLPRTGDYTEDITGVDTIGYDAEKKTCYYLKSECLIKNTREGAYNRILYVGDQTFTIHAIEGGSDRAVAAVKIGSRQTRGMLSTGGRRYFMPAYRDLGHVYDKKHPVGFVFDLRTGGARRLDIQRHAYWSDFDVSAKTLYHLSSSTGKLWITDVVSGKKKGELRLGDAGEDNYRKFGLLDENTLLYYIRGKLFYIDIRKPAVTRTVDLAARFTEFSGSSPIYILPGGRGIVVEARTPHNKTTGFLYYLREE